LYAPFIFAHFRIGTLLDVATTSQGHDVVWKHFPFKTLLRTFSGHVLVILAAERTRGRGIPQRIENVVHL
jgi:hypothetical protein